MADLVKRLENKVKTNSAQDIETDADVFQRATGVPSVLNANSFGKVEKSFNTPKLGFVPLGLITVFIRSYLFDHF